MDIVWRRQAERDLEHIFHLVLQHDPGAARDYAIGSSAVLDSCAITPTWVGRGGSRGRASPSWPALPTPSRIG
jgi:plasmid stabilization system protein ParE